VTAAPDDTISLKVGGASLVGWQRVTVTRSMDRIPAEFDLQVTERYPNTADVNIQPGQPCTVSIGADLVITGYVDRYSSSISPSQHTIRVQGRSKSADLVDCAAYLGTLQAPNTQVMAAPALSIATQLAAQYGVEITSLAGAGAFVPQFLINLGETVWEVIERLIRVSGFVAYDMPDGSLVWAQAGSESMASGFALGSNIEQADIAYSMDQRFSEYDPFFLSVQTYGTQGNLTDPRAGPAVHDPKVPRKRVRFVISEQMSDGESLAVQRAQWECNRNYGRSQQLSITVDGWRDSAGKLWAPNHSAPIMCQALKLANPSPAWIIGGVSYVRDENGQHAAITMMPPEAFSPEPAPLNLLPVMMQDMRGNNPTLPEAPKTAPVADTATGGGALV
jgi:prophage tail gpP-like protein